MSILAPRRWLTTSLALMCVAACCRSKPPCGPVDHVQLAPDASSPAWASLRDAWTRNAADNATLNPPQRLSDCRTQWQTVVESGICHETTLDFCNRSCATPEERERCSQNQDHYDLMQRCREQALGTFVDIYGSCAGFHLCNEVLQPASTVCPS
jgi:hypothetical protein